MWVKETIHIKAFFSLTEMNVNDIIFISESDFSPFTTIVYENFIQKIYYQVMQAYQYDYDYYYIKNALAYAKTPAVNTLITGSSYGLLGIDSDILTHEVNLSFFSQDLYYSLKGVYEVWEANKNIHNVVLCCSYYYFFSDLSRTQSSELLHISKVYEPLYHDIHNCTLLPPKSNLLYQSNIIDMQDILDKYSIGEYKKSYFTPRKTSKAICLQNVERHL